MATNSELLDQLISKKNAGIIDKVIKNKSQGDFLDKLENKFPSIIRTYVKENSKSYLTSKEIIDLISSHSEKLKPTIIEKTIRKEIVKPIETIREIEKKDDSKLLKQIDDLKNELEKIQTFLTMMGGSGVIGLPSLEGNNGKTLQIVNNQPKWQTTSSSAVYTPTNITTTRSFNAASTSIAELANVLGSLIIDLKSIGAIQ